VGLKFHKQTVVAAAVTSAEAFGRPRIITVIGASSIASGEVFGADRQVVAAPGIPSAAAVGRRDTC
jgi:hypothetical protein